MLNPNQHGFRPNHSCHTQLILLVENILKAIDSHHQVDLILLHFTKAFDTMPHKCLLTKLHYYSIYSPPHDWINVWLTRRYLKVIIEGEPSIDIEVYSGASQGTVSGPLMFLIYINDIASK